MAIDFNHTIVWARDSEAPAMFMTQILGLPRSEKVGAVSSSQHNSQWHEPRFHECRWRVHSTALRLPCQ